MEEANCGLTWAPLDVVLSLAETTLGWSRDSSSEAKLVLKATESLSGSWSWYKSWKLVDQLNMLLEKEYRFLFFEALDVVSVHL
jgi:hypothetical protein